MTDDQDRSSRSSTEPSGQTGRGPVDPNAAFDSPPPPPPNPQHYAYPYPPPQQQKRGVFGILGKVMGAIGVGLVLIAVGYYIAMFAVFAQQGQVREIVYQPGTTGEKIAIIPVEGTIAPETAEFVRRAAQRATRDPAVKAVILRVESPGGFVGPSEQIHHFIQQLRAEKGVPIIASYGSVAASGGYYVSAHADRILAQPTSATGSIGVIVMAATINELLTEKLGIQPEVIVAPGSPDKDLANDPFHPFTEEDRQYIRQMLQAQYDRFVEIVRTGRGETMSEEQLATATTGRVFLAEEALELKLIDEIGYLSDAIRVARDESTITADDPQVVIYRPPMGLLAAFGGVELTQPQPQASPLKLDGQSLRQLLIEFTQPQTMYLMRMRP